MSKLITKKLRYIIALASMSMLITFALPITQASGAADTCTWTGATDGDWNDSANWSGCDNTTLPEDGDTLVFPNGPTNKTLNNDIAGLDLDNISITGDGYTFTGNAIELSPTSSSLMSISGSNNDFGLDATLTSAGPSKSISSSGANNEISGALTLNLTGGADMNVGSSGVNTLTISGAIGGTTQGFIISNGGTVAYNGASNFTATGNLQINEDAKVSCGSNTCLGIAANDLAMYGGAQFITTGIRSLPYSIQTNTSIGTPTIEAQEELTLSGALDLNTDTDIIASAAGYDVSLISGGIDIDSSARTNLIGAGNYLDTTFVVGSLTNSGTLGVESAALNLAPSLAFDGEIIVGVDAMLDSPSNSGLGTTAGGITIQAGGLLRNGIVSSVSIADDITIEGTGNTAGYYDDGVIDNEGENLTFTGDITLTGDATILNEVNTFPLTFSGSITGTGNLTLLGDDTNGGIVLNGTTANDYVGDTYFNSVNVTVSKTANVIAIPGDAVVTAVPAHTARIFTTADEQIADDATITLDTDVSLGALVISGGSTETIGTLEGDGFVQLGTVNDELRVGGGNKSGTFNGLVTGTGGAKVIKIGTGTWNFQGANNDLLSGYATYEIAGGTFIANPSDTSLEDSNILVSNGGTLKGTGSIGPTTVNSGGTLSTGNSPGCITLATLTMNSGSSFAQEITGTTPCTDFDETTVTGAANLGNATLNMTITGTPTAGSVYTIISAASVTGTFNGLANGASIISGGTLFTINYNATNVTLTAIGPAPVASANNGSLPTTGTSISIAFIGLAMIIAGLAIARRRKNNLFI